MIAKIRRRALLSAIGSTALGTYMLGLVTPPGQRKHLHAFQTAAFQTGAFQVVL